MRRPLLAAALLALAATPAAAADAEHGEYVFHMAGCAYCHTAKGEDAVPLAGGRALETPFGTFHTPNITPDPETGIGGWSQQDFVRALRHGESPQGDPYYPAFPYTSYTRMTDADLADLKAYLDTVEPVRNRVPDHDLKFPFSIRWGLNFWQALFLSSGAYTPDPERSAQWNRGAYIVEGPGHCGECHTPRNQLGALQRSKHLTGNPRGPEGKRVPGIRPDRNPDFADWTAKDIVFALKSGMKPSGDFLEGAMGAVVDHSTGKLDDDDLEAVAVYLRSFARER